MQVVDSLEGMDEDMSNNANASVELKTPHGDDFAVNLLKMCTGLFHQNKFVDCTLSCRDGQLQAHRIVLSSSSQHLLNSFSETPWPSPCAHPLIMLRKFSVGDVRLVLEFMYSGKLIVKMDRIPVLIDIAQELGCVSLSRAIEIATCGQNSFGQSKFSERSVGIGSNSSTTRTDECTESVSVAEDQNNLKLSPMVASPSKTDDEYTSQARIIKADGNATEFSSTEKKIRSGSDIFGIDYGKGESFVYTNEDLGMSVDPNVESDSNGSEDDYETEPSPGISIVRDVADSGTMKGGKQEGKDAGDTMAYCPWCSQVFNSVDLLQQHVRVHMRSSKPFTCPYCNNTFARSAHLKRHLRTHTGEKPYQCSVCQRSFARQDKLKIHLQRHAQSLKYMGR